MAHKTKIGGTAYEIKGGKCLVNGTGYSIKKGRTLVGGTGYDISFVSKTPVAITITGTGSTNPYSACTVALGGKTYSSAVSGITINTGDAIAFTVVGMGAGMEGKVVINNQTVFTTVYGMAETYTWEVPSGITRVNIDLKVVSFYSVITVTTS